MSYSTFHARANPPPPMGFVSAIVTAVAEGTKLVSDVASGGPQKRRRARKAEQEAERLNEEARKIMEAAKASAAQRDPPKIPASLSQIRMDPSRAATVLSRLHSQKESDAKGKTNTGPIIIGAVAVVGVLGLLYWISD